MAGLLAACGGPQHQPPEKQGLSKNAPEWVARGSVVQDGSMYGVGAVAGIKNPSHARSTSANRARKEIAKIMETYSASLMKDYAASTSTGDLSNSSEEQHVEEVVKTFSAQLLTGVEIVNNWVDPASGTYYALAELNFERAKEIASVKATMGSSDVGKWLDEHGRDSLGNLEGDMKGNPPPAAEPAPVQPDEEEPPAEEPPVAVEPPPAPPPVAPPAAAEDGPAPTTGPAPAWKDGTCDINRFLCGVGDGAERKAADNDARAEIARIFRSNIKAVSQSFDAAAREISSKTGERWYEVNAVAEYSMVSTDKVVTMSQIAARWVDGNKRYWSLAVIDRAQAGRALRDRIQGLDQDVGNGVNKAKAAEDKVARFKALKGAVRAHLEREALNADLRVIQADGSGIPSPYRLSDLLALLDEAAGDLKLGLALSGAGAERVRACLEEALTDKGYQLAFNVDEDEDDEIDISGSFDVLIKGTVKAENRGKIAGGNVVQTTLTLKLINAKTGKLVRTITGSEKGTRNDIKSAASTSAFKICQKKVPSMVSDIDRYFGR
ncbi:MAG: LPP20 family lipoprotein [Myxococcales bacterium]|nr:LPP20 family lipoprotein [Myxococcales bacterium]MCB9645312.1 LPP20 family lipoprotein [Deltaproteobacteria bacterium]